MDCEAVISKEVTDLLGQHKSLQIINNGEKVKCLRSGHEMPCQLNAIMQYIGGKKYQKFVVQADVDMEKYKEVILPSSKPGYEHQLFCTLTCRHMNNIPHQIEQHVNGRKFQKAYQRWKHCQEAGESFKPLIGRKKERKDPEPSNRNGNEPAKKVIDDDLSDLYPVEDFGALGIDSDEDESESETDTSGKKKRKAGTSVSYQVKRSIGQKKNKSSGGKKKTKRMRRSTE